MAKGAAGYGLGLACFAVVAAVAGAAQFKVGGSNGWSVAGAAAESYNAWAMKNRFQIGDTLVFVYPKGTDSVLLVQPADYNACNTSSYDKKFADGNTVFALDRAGAFFFVSGVEANCRANEKLIVMVLAGRNGTGAGGAPPPASPAAPPPAASSPPPSASSPPPAPVPVAPAPSAPSPASAPPPASAPAPTKPSSPPPASAPAPTTPSSPPPASSPTPAPPTSSPTAPASPPLPTPAAPTGAPPMAPSANAPTGADGGTNSTGASSSPPPAGSSERNGASLTVTGAAGLAGSALACVVGYAMLAL